MLSFQKLILKLQEYWADQGCMILQPYDMEVGAGTSSPATALKSLGPDPWKVVYVQPCRRPSDGRYGENPNRTQMYYQLQVFMKPAPANNQELYLKSLEYIGLDLKKHDVRFVEDDWENPSLGAAGLGWEVWCDGLEISQYTYFQQVGGLALDVIPIEITYGLERIAAFLQGVDSHFDIIFNDDPKMPFTYGDAFKRNEIEQSHYNFTEASVEMLKRHFEDHAEECKRLLEKQLPLPAYDQCLKNNHIFNILDARGAISPTQRQEYMLKIRQLVKQCCEGFVSHPL
jgi:glycyl-tRNA synthetase alpha chain